MKKIFLWFIVVLLFTGCGQAVNGNTPAQGTAAPTPGTADVSAPCPTEGEQMSSYSGYIQSGYAELVEGGATKTGQSTLYVGNQSDGTAHFCLLPFPSDMPTGVFVSSATLRIAQTDDGDLNNALTLKIAPVTGSWNTSTTFSGCPAYDSAHISTKVFDSSNKPSSSNYDGRTYHEAVYKYYEYHGPTASGPWTLIYSETILQSFYNECYIGWGGTYDIFYGSFGETYIKQAISYTPAYYDNYWVQQEIDITNVMKQSTGATGLLLYFDLPGDNSTKKYFRTPGSSSADYKMLLTLTYGNAVSIAPDAGAIDKGMVNMMIAPDTGAIDKNVLHMKIYAGGAWKDVF